MISFARDDSRNIGAADMFSLQALNDSLCANPGPTLVEISLRAENGKVIKQRKGSRSKSKGALFKDYKKNVIGLVTSH